MTSLAARLPSRGADSSRLHLQHGPIDLVLDYRGPTARVEQAYRRASDRFESVLQELVDELPLLRARAHAERQPKGRVARRMHRATVEAAESTYVTPMAAVAGAVADEILEASWHPQLLKCSVNNGGDIAMRMSRDADMRVQVRDLDNCALAVFRVTEADGIGGVATSGRGGRSLTRGIAESVTVLADTAAAADVAATLIANAVDLPGCDRISRVPANTLDCDSDLGDLAVVTRCGVLQANEVGEALDSGACLAKSFLDEGRIRAAAVFLRGQYRIVENRLTPQLTQPTPRSTDD